MRRPSVLLPLLVAAMLVDIFACSKKSATPTAPTPNPCSLSPASINFGTVLNGQMRDSTFRITNTGTAQISGSLSSTCSDFSFVAGSAYQLQAGQHKDFALRFAPTSAGSHSCSISTPCGALTCSGTDLTTSCQVSPDTLSFGRPVPGRLITLDIHNTSTATVSGTVTSPCLSFQVNPPASYQIPAGQVGHVQVDFAPSVAGPQVCSLATGLPGCPSVVVTGIGQQCNVSPTSLSLGTAWDHIDKTFTITNTDSFPLQGTVSGCPTATIIGPASYNLAPGASQTFTVGMVNVGFGWKTCQVDPGIGTCSLVSVSDSSVFLDPYQGGCAAASEQLVDLGTMTVGQTATHVLHICGIGQCLPSSEYCYGFLEVISADLTFDAGTFSRVCGINDCRPLTATFTPREPGVHHVLVRVWTNTAGQNPAIEGYVEFRANVVPVSQRP